MRQLRCQGTVKEREDICTASSGHDATVRNSGSSGVLGVSDEWIRPELAAAAVEWRYLKVL